MRRRAWALARLGLVLVGLVPTPAEAVNHVGAVVQNAVTANGNGQAITTFGTFLVATYSISGTFVATVNFEAAGQDGTFQPLGCVPVTGGPTVSTVTTSGAWRCNIVSLIQIRGRVSGYVSGSVTVSLNASDSGTVLLGPPVDSTVPVLAAPLGLARITDPSIPIAGQIWLSLTTPNTVTYFEGTSIRSVVDLSLTQTLANKTLRAPTVVGTMVLTTPLGAAGGGTGLNTTGLTGTPHLTAGGWTIGDLRAERQPVVAVLPPGVPGRLVYQTLGLGSLWLDRGLQWAQLDDLSSPTTLANKTLAFAVALGMNRAPPTTAGQYAATNAANSGTMLTLTRVTDTSPAGNFLDFQTATATSLFTLDITGTITAYGGATPTNGQLLIGGTAAGTFAAATLTGTANQVTVTNGNNTITIGTPQNLDPGASPTFAALTLGCTRVPTLSLGLSGLTLRGRPGTLPNTMKIVASTGQGQPDITIVDNIPGGNC